MDDHRKKPGTPGDILKQVNHADSQSYKRKPGPPSDILEHYGMKGMRWGVRNEGRAGIDPISALGAAYVAIFLASTVRTAVRYSQDSGKKIQKQNANVEFKKNPELAKKMSVEDLHTKVVKPVNRDYPGKGTKMNCRRATMTYEMRRRGYDVTATKSEYASGQTSAGLSKATAIKSRDHESLWGHKQIATPRELYKGPAERTSASIFSAISKYPEGARGELAVGWKMGGGHSMAWEKVNGKAVIFDTQDAKTYLNPSSFNKFGAIVSDGALTRTDNAKLDEQFLKRWMTNA